MEPQTVEPCGLYTPGHLTHFIQIKVKFKEPRLEAIVELESPSSLRIVTKEFERVFYHHRAIEVYLRSLACADKLSFAKSANLLWFPPNLELTYSPAYLSDDPITKCEKFDTKSGFFAVFDE